MKKNLFKNIYFLHFIDCKYCEEKDGELIEIWSEKKQQEVNQFVDEFEQKNPAYSDSYWIGRTKIPSDFTLK